MIRFLLVSLVLACGVVTGASAADANYIRPKEDAAKLQSILSAVGISDDDSVAARALLSAEDARAMLWDAFVLIHDKHDYEAGKAALRRVLAYDPDFEAKWPDEKVEARAFDELAFVLYRNGEWEKALPALELNEKEIRIRRPNADTLGVNFIAECRRKLSETARLDRAPLIVTGSRPANYTGTVRGSTLMVPVADFAADLGLKVTALGNTRVRLTAAENGAAMELTLGLTTALSSGKRIPLSAAPERKGNGFVVPLRAVAERFGYDVKWEPAPLIAWVTLDQ